MLQLSQKITNRPIISLRTNTIVGTALTPIINPNNLKIEAFHCIDRFDKKLDLVLLYQDIRDVLPNGIVVNDHEVLVDPHEVVRLSDLIKLNFSLLGKPVVTVSKERVGKINDFATEIETMYIQKLYVGQSLLKSLSGGTLSVDRSQIYEITNRRIVINDLLKNAPLKAAVPVN